MDKALFITRWVRDHPWLHDEEAACGSLIAWARELEARRPGDPYDGGQWMIDQENLVKMNRVLARLKNAGV